jgi:CubicO group peptidase (beta-lactamase class C family)
MTAPPTPHSKIKFLAIIMNFNTIAISTFSSVLLLSAATYAADVVKEGDAGVRVTAYIDDTTNDYNSGWKAMITNVMPDKLLTSGVWFKPAKKAKPFTTKDDLDVLSDDIRARLRSNSTDGLLVIQNDKIVAKYFRYGFGIDDIHLIHSTGKVYTSFAMQPVYDKIGADGLSKPLEEYLPKLKGKFFGKATLAQSLDMKVGMEWSEDYEDPTSATMLSGPIAGWDPVDREKGSESWYERMFDFPKYGNHGEVWVYSSASVIASAFAGESISGKNYREMIADSYNVLGFEDSSWYVINKLDEFSTEGGQAMTIRDHAKLGRFMMEQKNSAYVNDVWSVLADANDPADKKFLAKYGKSLGLVGYKNYWYKQSDDVIVAIGSSGQFLYIDRSKNLIINKFSSFMQGQGPESFGDAMAVIRDIAATYK